MKTFHLIIIGIMFKFLHDFYFYKFTNPLENTWLIRQFRHFGNIVLLDSAYIEETSLSRCIINGLLDPVKVIGLKFLATCQLSLKSLQRFPRYGNWSKPTNRRERWACVYSVAQYLFETISWTIPMLFSFSCHYVLFPSAGNIFAINAL